MKSLYISIGLLKKDIFLFFYFILFYFNSFFVLLLGSENLVLHFYYLAVYVVISQCSKVQEICEQ